ncbi:hypothetical protein DNHGIG_00630 [Collibacillus ludicampi]|uniref:Uncharacterized protein n=1 Tax=Collibacillus ludicampi TaxID=2771369 RepID=A0AAV4L9V2_9BACL|nr:hypothetical protein [Collibacillus ludicampi]GIM44514.1 hypothetical protein DNHGIG_00630 [Collibacillus ludicampi]
MDGYVESSDPNHILKFVQQCDCVPIEVVHDDSPAQFVILDMNGGEKPDYQLEMLLKPLFDGTYKFLLVKKQRAVLYKN